MAQAELDIDAVRAKLQKWFEAKLPDADDVELSSLVRPGAGSSNETFLAELQWRKGTETHVDKLVVRWPPQGYRVYPDKAYDMARQFTLFQRMGATRVPMPRARWLEEDASIIGRPFYIVDQVEGWVPSDFPPYHKAGRFYDLSAQEKTSLWWNIVDTIGDIHTLDWKKAGLDFLGVPGGGTDYIEQQIAIYDAIFAQNNEPMPDILKWSRDWLLKNAFEPRYLSVVWGDARPGNMIINNNKVAAVLDWEMVGIGDPEVDLGWFAHMDWATSIGRPVDPFPRMPGLPGVAEAITHYEQHTGRKVEHLHYHEAFATWRMAIIYTRMENDERYLARSKNAKGFITWTHFDKLKQMTGIGK